MLIDIRAIPRSRHNPQFARDELAVSLRSVEIGYRWMPGLGGRRRPQKDSINGAWRNLSFPGYADYMQTPEFALAMEELLTFSAQGAALMCAEAVPWRCHRSLVGDALLARHLAVEDILYDAKGQSHRKAHAFTSFAHVDGERVWYPPDDDLFAASSQSGG